MNFTILSIFYLFINIISFCFSQNSNNNIFLERWMEEILPVISNQTILDLSLPGTHDSLTFVFFVIYIFVSLIIVFNKKF
jgi:hypothetical protein